MSPQVAGTDAHSQITAQLSRRGMLKGLAIGAAGLGAAPLLGACTGSSGGGGGTSSKTASVGSNYSDAVPKKAFAAMVSGFESSSGDKLDVNTVDHNSFQENINNYLQGSPDDAFTWFAGFRMRYYAKKGLVSDIDDVLSKISGNFSSAFAGASTGDDNKKYLVPLYNYPWAFFYRKSLWQEKGYQIPTTLDELTALGTQMKKDGLAPIGFADKDLWPACGTFDYLNMRINGYDFHIALMAHQKSWASPVTTISPGSDARGRAPPRPPRTAHSISRPTTPASTITLGSCSCAAAIAAGRSARSSTLEMPRLDPARAGLTNTGRPRAATVCVHASGSRSNAPGRITVYGETGSPSPASTSFMKCLSMPTADARTPAPT